MSNPFFKNHGPLKINEIFDVNKLKLDEIKDNQVNDVKDLTSAKENDLTIFHNKNYSKLASQTKASYCVTLQNLVSFLPSSCKPIVVQNVFSSSAPSEICNDR